MAITNYLHNWLARTDQSTAATVSLLLSMDALSLKTIINIARRRPPKEWPLNDPMWNARFANLLELADTAEGFRCLKLKGIRGEEGGIFYHRPSTVSRETMTTFANSRGVHWEWLRQTCQFWAEVGDHVPMTTSTRDRPAASKPAGRHAARDAAIIEKWNALADNRWSSPRIAAKVRADLGLSKLTVGTIERIARRIKQK